MISLLLGVEYVQYGVISWTRG
uniref:NADH dehydrogenase subunit 1 n=1 Tax=Heterorhabditis bacteriophora TaxID=37862 RepID=A0A1I7X0H6_HETBA